MYPVILIIQLIHADGSYTDRKIEIDRGKYSMMYCLEYARRVRLRQEENGVVWHSIECHTHNYSELPHE